ncbi:alpha/beta hydrolase [Rossellomorea marisflavi]|uniref:alpha/beta fold hydrolase n=1 Tax=Rossellomorea marisflavi TaxID=189381 RepID=UPI00345A6BA9
MKDRTIYKRDGKKRIMQHYDQYVNSFDFGVERIYVETSYGKTHVLVAGPPEGKPVFIFQGGNCINPMTLSWFLPLISQYRVYAPDTIGHPGFSAQSRMKEVDKNVIGDVFTYLRLEQDMPKLTTKEELKHFNAPVLIIAGEKDIFFPEDRLRIRAQEIIPNLIECKSYVMGHFPSEEHLVKINQDIEEFLHMYY